MHAQTLSSKKDVSDGIHNWVGWGGGGGWGGGSMHKTGQMPSPHLCIKVVCRKDGVFWKIKVLLLALYTKVTVTVHGFPSETFTGNEKLFGNIMETSFTYRSNVFLTLHVYFHFWKCLHIILHTYLLVRGSYSLTVLHLSHHCHPATTGAKDLLLTIYFTS